MGYDLRPDIGLPPGGWGEGGPGEESLLRLVLIVVVGAGAYLLWRWLSGAGLVFEVQILLLTGTICLVPTFVHRLAKQWGRVARVAVETLLFVGLLFVFGLWLLGTSILGIWIAYAVALIIVLEAGSHFIEWRKNVILERPSFRSLQSDADAIEKMFRRQVAFYISVPLGLVAGTIVGFVRSQTRLETVILCLQLVLVLASLVLLRFLIYTFKQMSDPLFKTSHVSSPEIAERREREGLLSKVFGKVLQVFAPLPEPETEDQDQKDLDLACAVSDLRKVYLYDAVHNVILLVAFMAVVMSMRGVVVNMKWLIGSVVAMALVFNQLPYVIGQSLLHERVLERHDGVKRAEMAEKLRKYAPLFPKSDFLAALFMTGTAGGLVYFLLDRFLKNLLK